MVGSLLFKRAPACWGCGKKPPSLTGARRSPNGTVLYFVCPSCGNPNHFDERGEILDFVPRTPEGPAPRFARKRLSPTIAKAPHETPPTSPVFCRNCLNNQKIVSTRIADYELPPDGHPDLDCHVNVLFPRFQKELEERFPLVCAECAPRANEQIRSRNYRVKVESLRQMLARSGDPARTKEEKEKSWGLFERLVWVLRGGVWFYSHFVMLAWSGSAMLYPDRAAGAVLGGDEGTWGSCIVRGWDERRICSDCYGVSSRHALKFLPWSVFGFFWIYWESALQRHPRKRLVGAKEYFWMEGGIWLFRMACWSVFAYLKLTFSEDIVLRIYLGIFFLSFTSTLASITCLKLEDPPTFSLREPVPISATPSPPSSPPQEPTQKGYLSRQPSYQSIQASPTTPRPPTKQTAPPTTGASTVYSPSSFRNSFDYRGRSASPSPAPAPNGKKPSWSPDAMDWNPTGGQEAPWEKPITQPSFTSSFNSQLASSQSNYKSPFTGTLPPAPKHQSHKYVTSLLQPANANAPAPPEKQQFFTQRKTQPPSNFPTESSRQDSQGSTYPPLSKQRFFLEDAQTGLEGLFGPGLKLTDEPDIPLPLNGTSANPWTGVFWRVTLLCASLTAILAQPDRNVHAISSLICTICLGTRDNANRSLARSIVACAGVLLSIAAAGIPGDRFLQHVPVSCALVGMAAEFWGVLILLQKERARTFYVEERRKKALVEERIKRARGGGNVFGGVGGLGLGR